MLNATRPHTGETKSGLLTKLYGAKRGLAAVCAQ